MQNCSVIRTWDSILTEYKQMDIIVVIMNLDEFLLAVVILSLTLIVTFLHVGGVI